MNKLPKFYKFLDENRKSHYTGYQYPPIGEWTETVDNFRICARGYHGTTEKYLSQWEHCGDHLYEIEFDTNAWIHMAGKNVVGQRARLVEQVGVMTPYGLAGLL